MPYLLQLISNEKIFAKDKRDKDLVERNQAINRARELAQLFDTNVEVFEKIGEVTPKVLEKQYETI